MEFTLTYPYPELSPNARLHRMVKAKAARIYKTETFTQAQLYSGGKRRLKPPVQATITFVVPDKVRRDIDNAIAAFKAGLDGIAYAVLEDDSADKLRLDWRMEVVPGVREVRVLLEETEEAL